MANTQTTPPPLAPAQLRPKLDPDTLGLPGSGAPEPFEGFLGQDRAIDAIRLAAAVPHTGFNVFVVGPQGSGRHRAVASLLQEEAKGRPVPDDWVYVNNFEAEHKPRKMRLAPGTAQALKQDMESLVDDLANDIPALFESEDYQTQRRAIEQEFGERHESEMADFAERAREQGVALVRTPMGFMLTAIKDGKPLKPDEFNQLDEDERAEIEQKIEELQEELAEILRKAPRIEREHRRQVEGLNASMAERVVTTRMEEIEARFKDSEAVLEYLGAAKRDIIDNADLFLAAKQKDQEGAFPEAVKQHQRDPSFDRYRVNVMVSHDPETAEGAPVIHEDLPNLDHLVGRIEHMSQMGALFTNFTMIKSGALHRANGGYLVLDARDVLQAPMAWDALKRSLKSGSVTITSAAERLGFASTIQLEPDPIPIDLRVALVGDRFLYALLVHLDPDFGELFKLQADFEDSIDRSDESMAGYARLLSTLAAREGLAAPDAGGTARALEEAIRLADDATKFTLRTEALLDLLREADHYARKAGRETIGAEQLDRAVAEQERRASRVRDRLREAVQRDILKVETDGSVTGQINGLSVAGQNGYRFGRPARITARVRTGAGKLVDIEREVELGGPLHSKGVMILSGYLTANYATDVPFSLHASLVFEQSYGGIDGDSASSAELYALLSALSGLPLRQDLAVTGSVSQTGEVQAIGGVNEKIEGFFDTCKARGLTGDQGVLIPKSNMEHLCLRPEVVEAVEAGQFSVTAVESIDQGIALLTGVPAGQRDDDGRFPEGSVHALVDARLRAFAEDRRDFMRRTLPGKGEEQ
ncbi:Lon protease family protein [Roseovarius salinarum]|uniref:Lon protease family protein n=1 Tax=Roseovarius salinarum TaxID=1981892 RepID=UPI000C349437|nr:ATP-binding protein [Roseovarius salinarum]